jgi:hypothetical protein
VVMAVKDSFREASVIVVSGELPDDDCLVWIIDIEKEKCTA